jgi:hypothetical protein
MNRSAVILPLAFTVLVLIPGVLTEPADNAPDIAALPELIDEKVGLLLGLKSHVTPFHSHVVVPEVYV